MCSDIHWGTVSFTSFKMHWVPNPHQHPASLTLSNPHSVYYSPPGWLVSLFRVRDWSSLFLAISLSHSEGSFGDASTGRVQLSGLLKGFTLKSAISSPASYQASALTGFPSSPKAASRVSPTNHDICSSPPLKLPWISPANRKR